MIADAPDIVDESGALETAVDFPVFPVFPTVVSMPGKMCERWNKL
jgi:hypothetical protein